MAGSKPCSTACNNPPGRCRGRTLPGLFALAFLVLAPAPCVYAQEEGQPPDVQVQPEAQIQPEPAPEPAPEPQAPPELLPPAQPEPGDEPRLEPQPQQPAPERPAVRPVPRDSAPAQRPVPGTAPPAPAPTPSLKKGEVLFNFQDADIQAVIKTVSQMTGRNFLVDPRVKGKITIISAKPVSAAAGYEIFLSALRAQGFTAVPGPAGITKILPEGEGKQNAPVASGRVRDGDRWITQVVEVVNANATQMVPLLRPLMAPSGLLSVYAPANTLIITDYAENVQRLTEIIDRLDQPGAADVVIIPLEFASAVDMAQLLERLSENVVLPAGQPAQPAQAAFAAGAARLAIVPDTRTNSLLVRTENPGRLAQLRALIEKLDVPAKPGGNTRVIYLRNADAEGLAEIVRGLLAGEARAQPAQARAQPAAAGQPAAVEASLIQAYEPANALIINAPDAVYNNLRAVIEQLDIRRAQVHVEALIAEVTSDKAAEFGFQWAGGVPDGEAGGVALQNFEAANPSLVGTITGALADVPPIGNGLSLAYLGHKITLPDGQEVFGLAALARALETDTDTNILSTPNLLTLDNAEARIVIGRNVPFLTGRFTSAGATTTGAVVNPFQTIERRDVGLTLTIKPQISEGNNIKLEIFQEVSSIVGTVAGAQDLITNKRSIETTVLVDNGDTVVLGGLIEDNVQENVQAVPLLSRIPLLGELFKFRRREKVKTNLMVFLRPVVVRNIQEARGITQDRYDYLRNVQQGMRLSPSLVLPTFTTPVLAPLMQPTIKEEVEPADETVQPPRGDAEPAAPLPPRLPEERLGPLPPASP